MNNQFAEKNEKREMTKGSFFYTIAKHRSTESARRNCRKNAALLNRLLRSLVGHLYLSSGDASG